MAPHGSSSRRARTSAVVVLCLAAGLAIVHLAVALNRADRVTASTAYWFYTIGPAFAFLAIGIGAAALLRGYARIIDCLQSPPESLFGPSVPGLQALDSAVVALRRDLTELSRKVDLALLHQPADPPAAEPVVSPAGTVPDQTPQELYALVSAEAHRRHWTRALAAARQLIDRFPDTDRAATVRQQLSILEQNAEIELRHQQEQRIQELLRGERYAEAVASAEDLIARYPASPQARELELALPRLRLLAPREASEAARPA